MNMEVLDLLVVALVPVLKLLLLTALGLVLALDRLNLLGPIARHHLNNVPTLSNLLLLEHIMMNYIYTYVLTCFDALILLIDNAGSLAQLIFYVFSPALVFSNLTSTMTLTSLVTL